MPVEIGGKPESDFTNPLGLLSDCHRRIERFLGVLVRVYEQRNGGELHPEERSALENALTYFRNSAPKHTADEEDSLFPRLRKVQAALACLEKLEGDHKAASQDHETVERSGRQWLEAPLSSDQSRKLGAALKRLAALYARHIAIEDNELFPLAAQVVPDAELVAIGREMAARRRR